MNGKHDIHARRGTATRARGRRFSGLAALRRALLVGVSLLGLLAGPGPVAAETIEQALAITYIGNPRLNAERARLRATDEELARAQAGYRPVIFGDLSVAGRRVETDPDSPADGSSAPKELTLNLTQPLFSGFRTVSAVSEADANILASREQLRGIEQLTLLDAATAYMDVIRDQAIVRLRSNNVDVLARDLAANEARLSAGEVTQTDVAQARARWAGAISDLELAKANLRASLATYEQVVGQPAADLRSPPLRVGLLPASLSAAVDYGLANHPDVVAAAYLEKAADFAVDRNRADMLPQLDLEATYDATLDPNPLTDKVKTGLVVLRLTVPLYQGGEVSARVRQAKHFRQGRLVDIEQARVVVKAAVISAWSTLQAAEARLRSSNVQVSAAELALQGVRSEEEVGQRTVLDVLDAEQELLNAQVARATAEHDVVVASYTLLATVGRLTAADLGLVADLYDVEAHYKEVDGKWFGTEVEGETGFVEAAPHPEASAFTASTTAAAPLTAPEPAAVTAAPIGEAAPDTSAWSGAADASPADPVEPIAPPQAAVAAPAAPLASRK